MRICYVDPKFQCIVVIKERQLKNTPGPYLNRFEKYSFTHKSVLEDIMLTLPKPIATLILNIKTEVSHTHYFLILIKMQCKYNVNEHMCNCNFLLITCRLSISLTVLMMGAFMGSVKRQ